ncbi:MAG: hypothetical protein AAF770_00995 [Bacteroidota bacterium]
MKTYYYFSVYLLCFYGKKGSNSLIVYKSIYGLAQGDPFDKIEQVVAFRENYERRIWGILSKIGQMIYAIIMSIFLLILNLRSIHILNNYLLRSYGSDMIIAFFR